MEFHLTDAGLAAFVNPANTGSNAIAIDRIGVSSVALPGDPGSHTGMLALPNELKRLVTFAGANVGDNIIHVTIRDESTDVYSLRTFGLYASTGVLLAYVTSADPISEKSPSSMTLIAADFAFVAAVVAEVVFGSTDFINPPATTETKGVVELATAAETAEGADATRAVTPFGLKQLLTGLLSGFALTNHGHAANDVTSGTFAVARIPDLAQAKITGLVDALQAKAAAAHTHVMSEIVGLTAALAAKLAVADFTWQNLVGKPNVAVNGQPAAFAGLTSNGSAVHTAATFDPSTKANINGQEFTGSIGVRAGGGGFARLYPGDQTKTGYLSFFSASGVELGYVGYDYDPSITFVATGGRRFAFNARPLFAGATPWDSDNFNPANYAGLASAPTFTGHLVAIKPTANFAYLDLMGAGVANIQHFRFRQGIVGVSNGGCSIRDETTGANRLEIGPEGKVRAPSGFLGPEFEIQGASARARMVTADGMAYLQAGDPSPDNAGGRLRFSGWFGTALDQFDVTVAGGTFEIWHGGNARSSSAGFRANADDKALTPNNVWAAAGFVGLVQAATIEVNLAAGLNFSTDMTGNRTLGAPVNAKPGQSGVIYLQQDGAGGRTLAFDPAWKFAGGDKPQLTASAYAVDILVFTVLTPAVVVASLMKDVR